MKLKHAVVVSDEELDKLYNIAVNACLTPYSSPDEQARGIVAGKVDFESLLNLYLHKAFKLGKKIARMNADSKDTKMYSADTNPLTSEPTIV